MNYESETRTALIKHAGQQNIFHRVKRPGRDTEK